MDKTDKQVIEQCRQESAHRHIYSQDDHAFSLIPCLPHRNRLFRCNTSATVYPDEKKRNGRRQDQRRYDTAESEKII